MRRIYVSGYDVDKYGSPEIERRFRKFGDINRIQMKDNYCFITFEDSNCASTAMDEMNDNYLGGKKLKVNPAYYKEGYQPDFKNKRDDGDNRDNRKKPVVTF